MYRFFSADRFPSLLPHEIPYLLLGVGGRCHPLHLWAPRALRNLATLIDSASSFGNEQNGLRSSSLDNYDMGMLLVWCFKHHRFLVSFQPREAWNGAFLIFFSSTKHPDVKDAVGVRAYLASNEFLNVNGWFQFWHMCFAINTKGTTTTRRKHSRKDASWHAKVHEKAFVIWRPAKKSKLFRSWWTKQWRLGCKGTVEEIRWMHLQSHHNDNSGSKKHNSEMGLAL